MISSHKGKEKLALAGFDYIRNRMTLPQLYVIGKDGKARCKDHDIDSYIGCNGCDLAEKYNKMT